MRIDCGRQQHRARGFTFQSVCAISRLGLLARAAMSSILAWTIAFAFLAVLLARQLRKRDCLFEPAG
jgi:hypothetical protein